MGCYGIGVSRILGAVAEHKADERGLNWPRAIAPFEIVVIPTSGVNSQTLEFHDKLTSWSSSGPGFDAVLDDRKETFGWKMQDADMIGYPVTIVLGKAWREKGICEVQCRSLSLKDNVAVEDLPLHLNGLLCRL
jgi:prolyl-tRNA synthetase